MILMTEWDETDRREVKECLEDQVIGLSEGIFQNMKCISLVIIITPDIHHDVYLRII